MVPGIPLRYGFGDAMERLFSRYAQNYPYLEDQIKAAIGDEAAHTIRRVWKKTEKNGHVTRGAKVTAEVVDAAGKTTIFEALFIKTNDYRGIIKVRQGRYTEKDLVQFCTEYAAELEKQEEPDDQGGKP